MFSTQYSLMSHWNLLWNFDGATPSGHKISMTSQKLTCLWSWQIFSITQITDCIRSVLNCDFFSSKISINQDIHFRLLNLVLMSNVAVQTGQQKTNKNQVKWGTFVSKWCIVMLLPGNPFVYRLRDAYQSGHAQGSDIIPGQTIRAAQLSKAFGILHHISGVYTHANNEVLTEHPDNCKPMVNQIRPAIVIIQAGSISLAQLAHFDANPCLQITSMPKSKPRDTPAPSTSCPPPMQ